MKVEVSAYIGNREVYRSPKPRKISVVTDATSAVLRELDAAPNEVMDWERITIRITRE